MPTPPSRRAFLKTAALSAGFLGLRAYANGPQGGAPAVGPEAAAEGFGPLQPDPQGLLRLPKGFSYKRFSQRGERMDDGYLVPGAHDGMAAFPGPGGKTLLVRNHEMSAGATKGSPFDEAQWRGLDKELVYDPARGQPLCLGGTTTLLYDTRTQALERHYLSLAGTLRNCSGGPTPWGSWITCEETVERAGEQLERDHGYNFEVPATPEPKIAPPLPLRAMGRFNHEAVAVDPATGIVYQTEDRHDGLIYRFLPEQPERLAKGGRLQALALKGSPSRDTRNWGADGQPPFPIARPLPVEWIDLDGIDAPDDDLRLRGFEAGAARFARGEGMMRGNGEVYFACTNGGARQFGQIFRYRPSSAEGRPGEADAPGHLELFVESRDKRLLKSCDNVTVAPWGDVVICEDDGASSAIVGITPRGKLYPIAHVDFDSELAGATFSPDGQTLFFNVQWDPGFTVAVTGPWERRAS